MATKKIDWEAVEIDYRCGVKTLRAMASEYGCAESAIRKRAAKDEWPRDLSAKIREKAQQLVRKKEVRKTVRTESPTEKQQVEALARQQADVELSHRTDITRARTLAMSLLSELESQTANHELFEQLGFMLRQEDDKGTDKLNDLYHKVISMSGRTSNMKQLADTLKTLVDLERRAYGIDARTGASEGLEDWLKKLDG